MYQVSCNFFLYVLRDAPDKLSVPTIKKGSIYVNTGDRVMVLAFCNFLYSPLSLYNTFRDMLRTSLLLQKLKTKITLK